MKKAFFIVILVLVVLFGGIFGFKAFGNYMMHKALDHMPPPTFSVDAAKATVREWHPRLQAVASLTAIEGTAISTQLAGNVTGIYFHSGEFVKKGSLLVQIDNSNQLAQLASDRASLHLAEVNLRRTEKLMETNAASQSQLDTAKANFETARAAIRNDEATLGKLAIKAPFSGYLGIRKVNLGQYLTPGTEIVDLQSWDPLYVNFTLPQGDLPKLQVGTLVRVTSDAAPGETFVGKITALGAAVDGTTRQIAIQATLPNPKHVLRPGMFAEAEVVQKATHKVLTVPVSAVSYNTYGDYVYLIHSEKKDGKTVQVATQQVVKPGEQRDGQVEILHGLKPGDLVVTAGQVKLSNNSLVTIHHSDAKS